MKRYLKNEDSSYTSFRRFNSDPSDIYPTYTLCFLVKPKNERGGNIIDGASLKNYWEGSKKTYYDMITGTRKIEEEAFGALSTFSLVTVKLNEIVSDFVASTKDGKITHAWRREQYLSTNNSTRNSGNTQRSKHQSSNLPFYESYENPDEKCFSRMSTFEKDDLKYEEIINLDSVALKKIGFTNLKVFTHYPFHTMRSFKEIDAIVQNLRKYDTKNQPYPKLRIKILDVKVIRKRQDANIPCNPERDNQDEYFNDEMVKRIGCIPPYAKLTVNSTSKHFSPCTTRKKLARAYYTYRKPKVFSKIFTNKNASPCTEMSVFSSYVNFATVSDKSKELKLILHYRPNNYMDTTNHPDYPFEDFLSSMGGYIGMFLGFGLLQTFEIVFETFSKSFQGCAFKIGGTNDLN